MPNRAYRCQIEPARLERVCRMYRTNKDAARALGVPSEAFGDACRTAGLETPYMRQRRQIRESQERKAGQHV